MKTLRQRKAGTRCARCRQRRWPFKDWTEPYTCQRCQEVLRGGNALDPLTGERSPAQQAATQALLRRPKTADSLGNKGG